MKMKPDSLTRHLLAPYIVLLTFCFITPDASASQSKVSGPPRLYSCSEVKELYPKFEELSRGELRGYLYEKFTRRSKSNLLEAYTHAKYYVCRFPLDNDDY